MTMSTAAPPAAPDSISPVLPDELSESLRPLRLLSARGGDTGSGGHGGCGGGSGEGGGSMGGKGAITKDVDVVMPVTDKTVTDKATEAVAGLLW